MLEVYTKIARSRLKGLKASWEKKVLDFKRPSGTSRGVLTHKNTWILKVWSEEFPDRIGYGECGPLVGLSVDDLDDAVFELQLNTVCLQINDYKTLLARDLLDFPSIRFGLEMALIDLMHEGRRLLFPSPFVQDFAGININGLIWMGEESFMQEQIEEKLSDGFDCIKMKIGAIDFDKEFSLLKSIRERFDSKTIEIRVDANGAFKSEAMDRLKQLASLDLHSIEQPIRQGQIAKMAKLCAEAPLDIALDEELIGVEGIDSKSKLLDEIQPQYIILKPTLLGGFQSCEEWIRLAEERNIAWWATSALESNIGLNAIAQWTAILDNEMPQGLGTGGLYVNNFSSPLRIINGMLHYDKTLNWNL